MLALQRDPQGNIYALPPELMYADVYGCMICFNQWCSTEKLEYCPIEGTMSIKKIDSAIIK